jgi:hypothetical protein
MFLRQCLQEVRIRRGESDLFLGGDNRGVWNDRGDTRDGTREIGAELALSRADARRSDKRGVARAKRAGASTGSWI